MVWLEEEIPLLRQIYEYDSTYHDIFRKEVLPSGAGVYLQAKGFYWIIPEGLQDTVDGHYMVLTLTLHPGYTLFPEPVMHWKTFHPRSLCVHYLYNRAEWKGVQRERITSEDTYFLFRISRRALQNLYEYTW